MNERMLDLAIQAKDWAYADHDGYTAQMLFEQKFALLIVKECARVAEKAVHNDNEFRCMYDILTEHFGVEE